MGKASTRAQNRYIAKAYGRINLTVAKGQKENHATVRSESVNGFISRAIMETMERDSGGMPPTRSQESAGKPQEGGSILVVSPDTLAAAQRAAGRTGEAVPDFVA